MNDILLSVIIPAYNCEKTISDCLETVLGQRLKGVEVIVVDDGSSDLTPEILRRYAERLRIISRERAGAGAARNAGIDSAKGKYVAFMDSDDKYPSPSALDSMVSAARESGARICGGSFVLWENGKLTSDFTGALAGYTFRKDGMVKYADYQFDYGYHRFIYEKKLLDENGVRFADYPRYQDPPFMVRAFDAAGEFYALRAPTYLYRADPGKVEWSVDKELGLIRGLTDEVTLSRDRGYAKLHRLIIDRIEGEFAPFIADAAAAGGPRARKPIIDMCAAVSGDLIGEGADYVPRPVSDIFAKNSDVTERLYKCEHELKNIKASMDYRVVRSLAHIPRFIKNTLRIGKSDF